MYFHGDYKDNQYTFLSHSADGLHFTAQPQPLGPFYFRVFCYQQTWYALAKTIHAPGGGVLLRSGDGITPFEVGQDLIPRMRHAAVRLQEDELEIFFTCGEESPEVIYVTKMSLSETGVVGDQEQQLKSCGPSCLMKGQTCPYCGLNSALLQGPHINYAIQRFFAVIIKIIYSTLLLAKHPYVLHNLL